MMLKWRDRSNQSLAVIAVLDCQDLVNHILSFTHLQRIRIPLMSEMAVIQDVWTPMSRLMGSTTTPLPSNFNPLEVTGGIALLMVDRVRHNMLQGICKNHQNWGIIQPHGLQYVISPGCLFLICAVWENGICLYIRTYLRRITPGESGEPFHGPIVEKVADFQWGLSSGRNFASMYQEQHFSRQSWRAMRRVIAIASVGVVAYFLYRWSLVAVS